MPSAFACRILLLFTIILLSGTPLAMFIIAALIFSIVDGIMTAQMQLRLPPY